MENLFSPRCAASQIGSMPFNDHKTAINAIFKYTPDIPCWSQLPIYDHEMMIPQFITGMPGLVHTKERLYIDKDKAEQELADFYQQYIDITENGKDIESSVFSMPQDTAPGFFCMLKKIKESGNISKALKGQITGPITLAMGTKDSDGKSIFYDDQLKDAAVKLLAMKAVFQIQKLSQFKVPVIIFLDEPGLAGVGSSEMISISKDEIISCLKEIIDAIHQNNGLAGIHVCANTDWEMVIEAGVDIINFDAYSYFDKFILYSKQIKKFIQSKGIIAWGIVPTQSSEDIDKETSHSITEKLITCIEKTAALGFDIDTIKRQSIITPSCGLGSLDIKSANKVLELTRDTAKALSA